MKGSDLGNSEVSRGGGSPRSTIPLPNTDIDSIAGTTAATAVSLIPDCNPGHSGATLDILVEPEPCSRPLLEGRRCPVLGLKMGCHRLTPTGARAMGKAMGGQGLWARQRGDKGCGQQSCRLRGQVQGQESKVKSSRPWGPGQGVQSGGHMKLMRSMRQGSDEQVVRGRSKSYTRQEQEERSDCDPDSRAMQMLMRRASCATRGANPMPTPTWPNSNSDT